MLKIDLHIHTLASGHAYSTILESVESAANIGVNTIAITDHGPSMLGGPYLGHFISMDRLPRKIKGVNVLMGCEANVVDYDGKIDLEKSVADTLDIILVGLHDHTPYPSNSSLKDNTTALIKAMRNNTVHIVSHPYRPNFPVDIHDLIVAANDYGVMLELNLSLLKLIGGNENFLHQIYLMLETINKFGGKVSISSDAHVATEIGDDTVLQSLNILVSDQLILGRQNGYNEVKDFLTSRKKP